jgi:adenosylhomocysteine nucleosidase
VSRARGTVNVIGVVTALRGEARSLSARRPSALSDTWLVRAGGMGCERAAAAALGLVRQGARALLCWGVAGALDPALRCGDVVLASEVLCDAPLALRLPGWRPTALPAHARLHTSDPWRSQLEAALLQIGPVMRGTILTRAELACESTLKTRLFRESGAVAVDMESAAVGVVASLYGLPFMVLRVIADTAAETLPAPLRTMASAQSLGPLGALTWLPALCVPTQWPALLRLGRRYRRAREVLRRCARQVGTAAPSAPAAGANGALP